VWLDSLLIIYFFQRFEYQLVANFTRVDSIWCSAKLIEQSIGLKGDVVAMSDSE